MPLSVGSPQLPNATKVDHSSEAKPAPVADAITNFQPERYRALAAECRQLALAAESEIEKTFLTNLAFSWNRLANQTDRYVEFLENRRNEKEN